MPCESKPVVWISPFSVTDTVLLPPKTDMPRALRPLVEMKPRLMIVFPPPDASTPSTPSPTTSMVPVSVTISVSSPSTMTGGPRGGAPLVSVVGPLTVNVSCACAAPIGRTTDSRAARLTPDRRIPVFFFIFVCPVPKACSGPRVMLLRVAHSSCRSRPGMLAGTFASRCVIHQVADLGNADQRIRPMHECRYEMG